MQLSIAKIRDVQPPNKTGPAVNEFTTEPVSCFVFPSKAIISFECPHGTCRLHPAFKLKSYATKLILWSE